MPPNFGRTVTVASAERNALGSSHGDERKTGGTRASRSRYTTAYITRYISQHRASRGRVGPRVACER